MQTTTSDRRQGSYYSIAENVLDAVAEQAEVERDKAAILLVDYDWRDGTHQEWLDTASVTEIVSWLVSVINDLDDEARTAATTPPVGRHGDCGATREESDDDQH